MFTDNSHTSNVELVHTCMYYYRIPLPNYSRLEPVIVWSSFLCKTLNHLELLDCSLMPLKFDCQGITLIFQCLYVQRAQEI